MRWLLLACWLLVMLGGFRNALAQAAPVIAEQEVKAAYLFKFGGYVEWPQQAFTSPDDAFTIGILGEDAIAGALTRLAAGRTVNGRPVAIRRLRHGDSFSGLNVLFIGRSNDANTSDILAKAREYSILTVTDSEDTPALRGMINFVNIGGKIRFEVFPQTAGLSNLNISARLLTAAYKVTPGAS